MVCAFVLAFCVQAARGAVRFDISLDHASVPQDPGMIDAGSSGREDLSQFRRPPSPSSIGQLFMSVDRVAVGQPGTPIRLQSGPPTESAHGDIYSIGQGGHALYREEVSLGLDSGFMGDDIDALNMSELPGPIDQINLNAVYPYYSLWRNSPLNGAMSALTDNTPETISPDDILVAATNKVFAAGADMGLVAGDDLDALVLWDVTVLPGGNVLNVPDGILQPGFDKAMFSLDAFSASTLTGGMGGALSPADLLGTDFQGNYWRYAEAADLGLLPYDNVDALALVPEPVTAVLLAAGMCVFLRRSARRARFGPSRSRGIARCLMLSALLGLAWHASPVQAQVVPGIPGDADGDSDTDLADFAVFQQVFSGSSGGADPGLPTLDIDFDDDVDGDDLLPWAETIAGPAGRGLPGGACAALGAVQTWVGSSPPVSGSAATLELRYDVGTGAVCFNVAASHPAPGLNLDGVMTDVVMPEQEPTTAAIFPPPIVGAPMRIVFSHEYTVPAGAAVLPGARIRFNCDLLLEGYNRAVLDVEVRPAGGGPSTVRYLMRPSIDLDVDSDNNSGNPGRGPNRDADEDAIEDDATKPGVVLCVNVDDEDADGIPDLVDGYDLDGIAGNDDDANTFESNFAQAVLAIPLNVDISVAKIRLTYSSSDPLTATFTADPPAVTPAAGRLRIWTADGDAARNGHTTTGNPGEGDFVPSGVHDATVFDWTSDETAGEWWVGVWIEAVRPGVGEGTERIVAEIDPDGPGPAGFNAIDAVRCTAKQLEFVESEEVKFTDVLPLFNSNPIVTLDEVANPGANESVALNVTGTVKDYIAPVAQVMVDGAMVNVVQTGAGPGGLGPFTGTFTAPVALTGNDTLIEAHAINALRNLGYDSVRITVARDADFAITGRTVTAGPSVPAAPMNEAAYLDGYRFKAQLDGLNADRLSVDVRLDTEVESLTLNLARTGGGPLQSKDLFLVPENLVLPPGTAADIVKTRIKARLGAGVSLGYSIGEVSCGDSAVTKGTLLRKITDQSIAEFVESATAPDVMPAPDDVCYEYIVGLHGSAGPQIALTLLGTDHAGAELVAPQPPALFATHESTFTLYRQSGDPFAAEYNLYKRPGATQKVMGLRTALPVAAAAPFAPQENPNVEEVHVEFDGGLKAKHDDAQLGLVEPVVGAEIVADRAAAPFVYKATGLVPVNNPAPPVVSVADGAPRPIIEDFIVDYSADAANPRRFRVRAKIKDQLADMITGNTLAAVGLELFVNGVAVPGGAVTINRAANDPPRPFTAALDMTVDLTNIPAEGDFIAYEQRRAVNTRAGANESPNVTIALQAVILEVRNAIGNRSWDSAFCEVLDNTPQPAAARSYVGNVVNDPPGVAVGGRAMKNVNRPTLYDVPKQLLFARYHNPFRAAANTGNQTLSAGDATGDLYTRQVQLARLRAGNFYSYGPFLVGSPDRWVPNAPDPPADMPLLRATKYKHDPEGAVTEERVALAAKITVPAPSREDVAATLPIDQRFTDQAAGGNLRDELLPTGSDAEPTTVRTTTHCATILPASGIPEAVRDGINVNYRLRNVTNFTGYCNNAPANPVGAAHTRDDFAFDNAANSEGPTTDNEHFADTGEVRREFFSKDFGGRAVLEVRLDIPGNAMRPVLAEVIADDDGDFLPRAWERRFRGAPGAFAANNPIRDGLDDSENRSLAGDANAHIERGDGYTALEEYRGFRITYVAPGAPPPAMFPLAIRADEIPFAYGVAPGAGVRGPFVKDVYVLHQSTVFDGAAGRLAMDTTVAPLFNLGWHKIAVGDAPDPQPLGGAAPVTTHVHQFNTWGDNDGFNRMQNFIHIRDDATVEDGTLAISMGFSLNPLDVRIRPASAGGAHGFGDSLVNGNTLFHELGHKVSMRHCINSTSGGVDVFAPALHAENNTDVTGDMVPDGALQLRIATYRRRNDAAAVTSARGTAGEAFIVNGVFRTPPAIRIIPGAVRDSYGIPIRPIVVFPSTPFVAGATFGSRVLVPELLDWMDYWIAAGGGGPTLQQNLDERQIFNPGAAPAAAPVHAREVRCRTRP
jgi:hypothetical protein